MHENHVNEKETAVENTERIAKNYAYERPAIQRRYLSYGGCIISSIKPALGYLRRIRKGHQDV
ncbi:Uncharacterised protein [Enterococcus faecalis]|uniref:Uncharacterized protein n=1 Tax=Enterococcus faecalis TaxID=1351 RepID=A0AAX2KXF2_ENTFL|nr:Uncharacterised protein [Enterococcus faecalis]